jgi:hypothetical protein
MVKVQDGQIIYSRDVLSEHVPEHGPLPSWAVPVIIVAVFALIVIIYVVVRRLLSRRKGSVIDKAIVVTSPGTTPEPNPREHQTVNDVVDLISVEQAHSVACRITPRSRKASISRMQLKLRGTKAIPGGWRGKIAIVSGIDRRYTIVDTINLPRIEQGAVVPIGPFDAPIPRDVKRSRDKWSLKFYIADPHGGEAIIFKSPSVSFI